MPSTIRLSIGEGVAVVTLADPRQAQRIQRDEEPVDHLSPIRAPV
jgi:hypothetical protein